MAIRLFTVLAFALTAGCGAAGGDDDGSNGGGPDAAVADLPPLGPGAGTLSGASTSGNADGPRGIARFNNPVNVMVLPGGDLLVADYDNHLLRRVAPDGTTSTVVRQDDFRRPFGITRAGDGRIYVQTDWNDQNGREPANGSIWEVDLGAGAATMVARDVGRARTMVPLPGGDLLLLDYRDHTIRRLDPGSGQATLIAGASGQAGYVDGVGSTVRLDTPYDAVLLDADTVLFADRFNNVLRTVTLSTGEVATFAGTGTAGSGDGTLQTASFDRPQGLAMDDAGNVYVTDCENYTVRMIDTAGNVETIAGGAPGHADDENPLAAKFYGLEGIDVTPDGSKLYVADGNRGEDGPYHYIRRITLP